MKKTSDMTIEEMKESKNMTEREKFILDMGYAKGQMDSLIQNKDDVMKYMDEFKKLMEKLS